MLGRSEGRGRARGTGRQSGRGTRGVHRERQRVTANLEENHENENVHYVSSEDMYCIVVLRAA